MRIATFNIGMAGLRMFGHMVHEGVPHSRKRWPAILRHLTDNPDKVDIWLLQEAYGPKVAKDLKSLPNFSCVLSADLGRDMGLSILVRNDWSYSVPHTLPFAPLDMIERLVAAKGLLCVKIAMPTGVIQVANLHTSYDGMGPRRLRRDGRRQRQAQMHQVVEQLNSSTDDTPAILGGDFNFSEIHDTDTFNILGDAGWRACRPDTELPRTWSAANPLTPSDPAYPDQDLDMLLLRETDNLKCITHRYMHDILLHADGRAITLSDHYALLVDVFSDTKNANPKQTQMPHP